MIDLSMYQKEKNMDGPDYFIVPTLRLAHVAVPRHIVRVIVEGDYAGSKVSIEKPAVYTGKPTRKASARQSWDVDRFFSELKNSSQPNEWIQMGEELFKLKNDHDSLSFSLGTGKNGSLTLKRDGNGLIEYYIHGQIRFRKRRFRLALGNKIGQQYEERLAELFPPSFNQNDYPTIRREQVVPVKDEILSLIRTVVAEAEEAES
jgi:hypothetical protein